MNLLNLSFNNNVKVIDCFTFYNELDMLDFRLKELNSIVDYFIIVEANKTHSGNDKPLWFEINKTRYSDYLNKIIHIVVDDFPETLDAWIREKFQRNAITRGLNKLNLNPLDIILICDVDEVPNTNTILSLKRSGFNGVVCLEQDFYYYDLEHKFDYKWYHPKVCTYSKLLKLGSPEDVRFYNVEAVQNGGWHLSYFGSPEDISNKVKNFAHQEFNDTKFTNIEAIKSRIKNSEDLFGRNFKLVYLQINENTNLPMNWKMIYKI